MLPSVIVSALLCIVCQSSAVPLAQCSQDIYYLYSLDFNMCLLVIVLGTARHLWVELHWAVQLRAHVVLATLSLYSSSISHCPWRSNKHREEGTLFLKARLASGRITAAAIMKPITIIRFNWGCRDVEIERRKREAEHKVRRVKWKQKILKLKVIQKHQKFPQKDGITRCHREVAATIKVRSCFGSNIRW